MTDIARLLGSEDIFQGFDPDSYDFDLQGWGGHPEFFCRMVSAASPKLAIEVGTWKGKSAVATANAMKLIGLPDSKLVCVDTWLGATEFVGKPDLDPKRGLRRVNGYPTVYYQFLANIAKSDHVGRIIPFPQSSINAARFFLKNNVQAELIYIDGSHEYEDVAQDLEAYGKVLAPGGILFGDDYCDHWSGVIRAVNEYADRHGKCVSSYRYHNGLNEAPSDYWFLT